jgi:putative membrane protein
MGLQGFVVYCVYSLAVFLPLGAAWACSAPPLTLGGNLLAFSWARVVREAASDFLPFSQIGGLVVGTRTLVARGHSAALINASLLVDLTTEMASQVVLTVFGIAGFLLLRSHASGAQLMMPILLGTALLLALMGGFFAAQRWALGFGVTMLAKLGLASGPGMTGIKAELARIYACRRRVLEALAFNFLGWIGSASGAWVALQLMGTDLSLTRVLVIESLIFVLRSVAFAIPSAIGVQEAAYVLLGPLLGLPPAAALALSLAKRARELAIGLPALAIWQFGEVKALRRAARGV